MASAFDVHRIAALANLDLSVEELRVSEQEFSAILEFVNALAKVEVEGVLPTAQVTDVENVFRQDGVVAFAHHRTLLERTSHRHPDLFKVPSVFSGDEP